MRVLVALAVIACALYAVDLAGDVYARPGELFTDFETNVWEAGRDVLRGDSPLREGRVGSVYPPISFLVTMPFALPPQSIGLTLWLLALVAAVVAALYLCAVRDWRLYALALLSPPMAWAILYGAISPPVVLAIAVCWRWRDSPRVVGPVLGLVLAARLFVWPLLAWLAVTRRWHELATASISAVFFTLVGWAAVGFKGVTDFPDVTQQNVERFIDDGVSVAALATDLGASGEAASAIAIAAGLLALARAIRSDDLGAFTWCLIASLLASPIVWMHYLLLLFVPLVVGLSQSRIRRAASPQACCNRSS